MYNKTMKRKIIILLILVFQIFLFSNVFGSYKPKKRGHITFGNNVLTFFPSGIIAYDTKIKSHFNLGIYIWKYDGPSPAMEGLVIRKTFGGDINRYSIMKSFFWRLSIEHGICFQENKDAYDIGFIVNLRPLIIPNLQLVYVSHRLQVSIGLGI